MKILFVTRKYPPSVGGMETFSAGFVRAFGNEVTIRALRGAQINLLWWYPITLLYVLVVAKRYEIIHFGDGVLAVMAAIVHRLTQRPVTITLHGLDVVYPRWPYQSILRWSLAAVQQCICVSRATATAVQQRGIAEQRISIIPNGITVEAWPLKPNPANSQPRAQRNVLSVGRLVPRKGIAWFVEQVLPKLDQTVHYHIVGSGPELIRLQQLVHKLNLADRVTLHGAVSDEQLRELYLQADVFVLPNIAIPSNPEGFGIVALEAAICGVPVIAAALDGIADAVIDGQSGFLVKSASVSDWLACVQLVLNTKPLSPQQVRSSIADHFSWEAIGKQYRTVFNNLIVSSNVKR